MNPAMSWGFFFWAGILLGASFIATPAKFLAPSLPLAQALDVDRWTFYVLALIEWGLVALFAVLVILSHPASEVQYTVLGLLSAIGIVPAVETFAIRPILDARVARIIGGQSVGPSFLHNRYVGLEIVKLALILAAGVLWGRVADGA